jgi:bacillithiol system protein YtxJ
VILDLAEAGPVEQVLAAEVALIYKHSPRCGSSLVAETHVGRFAERFPEVPVYRVDVVRHRALARTLARTLAVRHESPQVILLRRGAVVWVGSHGEVDADTMAARLAAPLGHPPHGAT